MKKKTTKKADSTFEDAIEELESVVEQMEQGDIPLAEAVKQFERGSLLLKTCKEKLGKAELVIEKLSSSNKGLDTEPFEFEEKDALED